MVRIGALAICGGVVAWLLLLFIRTPVLGTAERGRVVFQNSGCVACHGDAGLGDVGNPGSEETDVPGFVGGTAMMYVETEAEIREWILDGRPKRLKKPPAGEKALIKMPAFRDRLSSEDVDALVAYYKAVGNYEPSMPDAARLGYKQAKKAGCFGCHGPAGRVGPKNPGSFKGYIPAWGSDDYFELVADKTERRQWIEDGGIPRFTENMAAQVFIKRQLIKMPAYADVLSAEQIDSIVEYMDWVEANP